MAISRGTDLGAIGTTPQRLWTDEALKSTLRAGFLRFDRLPILFFQHAAHAAELPRALPKLAAIPTNHFAINVARSVAHQKRCQIGQLLDGSKSMQRIALQRHLLELRQRH